MKLLVVIVLLSVGLIWSLPCTQCETIVDASGKLQARLKDLESAQRDAQTLIARLQTQVSELKTQVNEMTSVGTTFTRWGKSTCPSNGTDLVFSGLTAGSHFTHEGAAANLLCLTKSPLWNKYDDAEQDGGLVYGAEYKFDHRNRNTFFGREITDQDPPCAVCRTRRSSVMMIPGKNQCLDGWTLEYQGYLSAGSFNHKAATEFVCIDEYPDARGGANNNGNLLYLSEVRCRISSLCPPYINGRELTCVVCTK